MMVRIHHVDKRLLTKEQRQWVRSSIGICKTFPSVSKFIEQLQDKDRSFLESFNLSSICERLRYLGFEAQGNIKNILGLRKWDKGLGFESNPHSRYRNPAMQRFSYKLTACPRPLLDAYLHLHLTEMIAVAAINSKSWDKLNFDKFICLIDRRLDLACKRAYFSYFEVRKTKLFFQRFFSLSIAIQKKLTIYHVPFTQFFRDKKGFPSRKTSKQSGLPRVIGYDEFGIPIFADSGPVNSNDVSNMWDDSDSSDYWNDQDSCSWST